MGRDEHKTSRGKRHLAQTPKQQISDGIDFEFSNELFDHEETKIAKRKMNTDKDSKK